MEHYHIYELVIIIIVILYLNGKLKKSQAMDIYQLLDDEARMVCDAMLAQTKLETLEVLHKKGYSMLSKRYKKTVSQELLSDYLSILDETYNLCRTILTNHGTTIFTPSLN